MDKLLSQFCPPFREALARQSEALRTAREIRVRAGRPVLLCGGRERVLNDLVPDARQVSALLLAFCDQALYAHEEQLRQGFITLPGGHRVGLCGHMAMRDGAPVRLKDVQAMNVRIARQMPCPPRALEAAQSGNRLRSLLVVSPPGYGKTTLLRSLARALSEGGAQVAIADERGELAALRQGEPQLEVGPRTDVMDHMPKADAVRLLARAMSPDVVISDEIGSAQDAEALLDARRCGVQVLCSAHGESFDCVRRRGSVGTLLREGVFDRVLVLGREPGRILAVYDGEGRPC